MLISDTKIALVDFDGTLFVTKDALYSCYSSVFKSFNRTLKKSDFLQYIYYSDTNCSIIDLLDGDVSLLHEVRLLKISIYPKFLNQITLNTQLLARLDRFETSIIFSNASRSSIKLVLNKFNLNSTFKEILTPEIFKHRKPEIEAFKNALSYLNLEPQQVTLYDDDQRNIDIMKKLGGAGEIVILEQGTFDSKC
jgi:FMN phosphatase YigB (HAD superfamily)